MRMLWTLFFLGSMLLVGVDVMERRTGERVVTPHQPVAGDPMGVPTPQPGL
jgi:hypothetical protein